MPVPVPVYLDDIVQMRKAHPCGGDTWQVTRVGAEIGLRCLTCNRRVRLSRADFERRIKHFVQRGKAHAASPETGDPLP